MSLSVAVMLSMAPDNFTLRNTCSETYTGATNLSRTMKNKVTWNNTEKIENVRVTKLKLKRKTRSVSFTGT